MVLLSGKRKQLRHKLLDISHDKELLHQHLLYGRYNDAFSRKIVKIVERDMVSIPLGNLGYHFKTALRISPEYELYHMWYGKPENYDESILSIIKDCISKKMHYSKIKSMLMLCHTPQATFPPQKPMS